MTRLPPLLDQGRRKGLALVAALTLLQGLAAGAAALATRTLFQALHLGQPLPVDMLAALTASGMAIAAARIAARTLGERIGQGYAHQIRTRLFAAAAAMPARAVARRRNGYMSLRFVGDMTAFRNWVGLGLPRLMAALILVPAALAVMWLLHPAFLWVAAPATAGVLVAGLIGGLRLVPLTRRLRTRRARIAADMAERMPLAPHLDRLGRRKTEIAQLARRTDAMIEAALRHRLLAEGLKALPDVAAGAAAAGLMLVGHRLQVPPGTVAGGLAAMGLLALPLRELGGIWNHHAAFRAAAAKAEATLSRGRRDLYAADRSLPAGPVGVVFDGLRLPSGAVLDATIPAATQTDLPLAEIDAEAIGDLLLGLDHPRQGRVLLSGVDLRHLSRGSLRRGVLRIGPMPEILQGSLRRALSLGCGDRPDDERLGKLARTEGLEPLILRLGGLSGTVLEGGRNLTQGERTAISLVRMRLLRPRLVIADPNLDPVTLARAASLLARRHGTLIRPIGEKHRSRAA